MKLYAYCLVEGVDALPDGFNGIADAEVRLFRTGDFSLLVSDFAGDAVAVNRENVLKHAAVVNGVLAETTPLPFRFGTLTTEQELQSYLTARRETLQMRLALVRGCVEMSVKIILDRERTEESPRADKAGQAQDKPGTAFLSEKRRRLLGSEARAEEAKSVAAWLQSKVGEVVREERTTTNPTEKLLLVTAHLVKRASVQLYRTRVTEARQERPELHFLVSGPWAPYSFANIDLEFKTQFGVS